MVSPEPSELVISENPNNPENDSGLSSRANHKNRIQFEVEGGTYELNIWQETRQGGNGKKPEIRICTLYDGKPFETADIDELLRKVRDYIHDKVHDNGHHLWEELQYEMDI